MTTFTEEFKHRLAAIEADGKLIGLNFTTICEGVNVSRATPDRWKKKIPCTVELVTKMEAFVAQQKEKHVPVLPR